MDAAIKAAKKILKKEDSGSLKLKSVVKTVSEKINGKGTQDEIKKWICASDKFAVDGKNVSIANTSKKRKVDDTNDEKAKKKAAKKAKKEAKKKKKSYSSESSPGDLVIESTSQDDLDMKTTSKWRTEHKIVLKSTTDDEEGKKASKLLNENEAYIPYTNFVSDRIKSCVNPEFLNQCTIVNGFTKPSAIQAQCWPVLLNKGSDGKRRDIVG